MQITDVVSGLAAGVGIRVSPDGGTLYYVEWSVGELSKADPASGTVETVCRNLSCPEDVLVDWDTGDVFVTERTGAVKKVSPGGRPTQIATPGGAPHQMALCTRGGVRHLYTVGHDSGELTLIDLGTGATSVVAGGLGHPTGLVVDESETTAYVSEQDSGALLRVDISTGASNLVVGGLVAPFFLAWTEDAGAVFCVQRDPANSLVRVDLAGASVSLVAGGLSWRPSGVAPCADDSLIYVCADREVEVVSWNGAPQPSAAQPPFEVYSVQFYRDGGEALRLQHHRVGVDVPFPEYVAGVRNEPAGYVAGARPKVRVVLRKLPGLVVGPYAIGATGSHGGIRRQVVTPVFGPSGQSAPIDFEFLWPLPRTVGMPDVTLDWNARPVPAPAVPVRTGTTAHRLYLPLAAPTQPWNASYWVEAFELACRWADGASTLDAVATRITERYFHSGRVWYDKAAGATHYGSSTFSFGEMLERLTGGVGLGGLVNCRDSADTVVTLANLLGCELWEGVMGWGFAMNEVVAIGYGNWEVPFDFGFNYHEVAWKGGVTENDRLFDGCLLVDGDADPTSAPHVPLLPANILFGDCRTLDYRLRLCTQEGCPACNAQPASKQQRQII